MNYFNSYIYTYKFYHYIDSITISKDIFDTADLFYREEQIENIDIDIFNIENLSNEEQQFDNFEIIQLVNGRKKMQWYLKKNEYFDFLSKKLPLNIFGNKAPKFILNKNILISRVKTPCDVCGYDYYENKVWFDKIKSSILKGIEGNIIHIAKTPRHYIGYPINLYFLLKFNILYNNYFTHDPISKILTIIKLEKYLIPILDDKLVNEVDFVCNTKLGKHSFLENFDKLIITRLGKKEFVKILKMFNHCALRWLGIKRF